MITTLCAVAVLAMVANAMAGDAKNAEPAKTATVTGAGFHCCHGPKGGNASVKINGIDNKTVVQLARVGKTNAWQLVTSTPVVCPVCGGTNWVSFSNNSGVPNGKNIQLSCMGCDPKPIVFDITVKHRVLVNGQPGPYLVYDGVGENFKSTDQQYVEWLNNVKGFEFLNLHLVATRANDPGVPDGAKGYDCVDVTATGGTDLFYLTTYTDQVGNDLVALIKPELSGHYEITFWYEPQYVFVPYFYYGTHVWDLNDGSYPMDTLHGDHAAALKAFFGSDSTPPRIGWDLTNGPYTKYDAQKDGMLLQSEYDRVKGETGANGMTIKDFWDTWGAAYKNGYTNLLGGQPSLNDKP